MLINLFSIHEQLESDTALLLVRVNLNVFGVSLALDHQAHALLEVAEFDKHERSLVVVLLLVGVVMQAEALGGEVLDGAEVLLVRLVLRTG